MDIFLATQPIFDKFQNVFGYEILYRSGLVNSYSCTDPDMASSRVLIDTFYTIGIDKLTGGKPAFINFTKNLIHEELATLLPPDLLIMEILETVILDDETVEKCKMLKSRGYTIALDDFVDKKELYPLVQICDIIKVDFIATSKSDKYNIFEKYSAKGKKMLAEKVETLEDFEMAKKIGYTYFQGYFFKRPEIHTVKDIPPVKFNYIQLIGKVHELVLDFDAIANIISRDVYLSYKLLRLVNSAIFGFKAKVESIKQALVSLGEKELKKWVSLIALRGVSEGKPDEVIRTSLIRAKFGELISRKTNLSNRSSDIFLAGLFSMLEVSMNRPLEEILSEIYISTDIKDALILKNGIFIDIFNIVIDYENGNWNSLEQLAHTVGVSPDYLTTSYLESIAWAELILK